MKTMEVPRMKMMKKKTRWVVPGKNGSVGYQVTCYLKQQVSTLICPQIE